MKNCILRGGKMRDPGNEVVFFSQIYSCEYSWIADGVCQFHFIDFDGV